MTLVTVCVPCYEQQDWLAQALTSVVNQTYPHWECIVIDDGSRVPITLPVEDKRLRLVRVTNRGLASARNTGLMLAGGEGFLPLDSDDWLLPEYLETTIPLFKNADVVVTGIQEHGVRNGRYPPGYDRPWQEVTLETMWQYNRFYYCNTPEAPVWMYDLAFRPLGDIQPGDEVIGWEYPSPLRGKKAGRPKLCRSVVLAAHRRNAPLVRVVLESGRELRCTADHWWHSPQMYLGNSRIWESPFTFTSQPLFENGERYIRAEPGRLLAQVVDPPDTMLQGERLRLAGWLGGIYDGEGTGANITQSPGTNPDVCARIRDALGTLGVPFVENGVGSRDVIAFRIVGGKQALVNFVHIAQPARRSPLRKVVLRSKFRHADRILHVEPNGIGEVVSLQTTTGNYTAWGYASRNCSLFRTEVLRSVGGYNAKMTVGLEDYDLHVDLMIRGAQYAATNELLFCYRTRADSMLQQIHRDGGHSEMVAEMRRHHGQ